jgi:hypothetical protein
MSAASRACTGIVETFRRKKAVHSAAMDFAHAVLQRLPTPDQ